MSLGPDSVVGSDSSLDFKYERHRPEETLLYQIVDKHYPDFQALMAAQGSPLPGYVQIEFEAYFKCGLLEHGFLRVKCEGRHHERLVVFSCKRRGFCPSFGARRMVDSAALLVKEGRAQGRKKRVIIQKRKSP